MSLDTIIQLAAIAITGIATYVGISNKLTRLEERDAAKEEKIDRLEEHDGEHYKVEAEHEHRITVLELRANAKR